MFGRQFSIGALALVLALGVGGCTDNVASDTTCGEFNKMTTERQTEVIKKVLSDAGNTDPTNAEVNLKRTVVAVYCQTAGRDSDPIGKSGI